MSKLSLIAADFFERPVKLRLPFRFGVVTLREAPQVFVRARIKLADGRESEGVAADILAPKWFDKSANLSNEDNFDQLRVSLAMARDALLAAGRNTPFGLSAAVDGPHHDACAKVGLNGLVASFGLALIDRAIIDALGRLEGASVFALVKANRLGLDAATATDLKGFDFGKLLGSLTPAASIHARHTVGLVDALTRAETDGQRIDDGLAGKSRGGRRGLRPPLLQAEGRRENRGRYRAPVRHRGGDRPRPALPGDARRQRAVSRHRRGDRAVAPYRRGAAPQRGSSPRSSSSSSRSRATARCRRR